MNFALSLFSCILSIESGLAREVNFDDIIDSFAGKKALKAFIWFSIYYIIPKVGTVYQKVNFVNR